MSPRSIISLLLLAFMSGALPSCSAAGDASDPPFSGPAGAAASAGYQNAGGVTSAGGGTSSGAGSPGTFTVADGGVQEPCTVEDFGSGACVEITCP